ncbi:hypothetical protein J437_LFUL011629 [Ladona fulva]|uniref:Craniofacial development protein 2-like n=1 Tax=Ladona fulva TaxID=123851 RepID=A0A8K0NZS9_LADFU|nr:hypothetical protein J437_LFUL011629 [Ladona fulva]
MRNGVGIFLHKELKEEEYSVNRRNDRIMSLGVGETTILSVYPPQAECKEEEEENVWRELDSVLMETPNDERVIVGEHFNGHAGKKKSEVGRINGGWNYGNRNRKGNQIIYFAIALDVAIANTAEDITTALTFKNGKNKSQIDYIMCRRKHLREVRNVKVINGDSVVAPYRLVVADLNILLRKRSERTNQREQRIKWWKLKEDELSRNADKEILGVTSAKGPPEDKETWWWNEDVNNSFKAKKEAKKKWDLSGSQEAKNVYLLAKKQAKRSAAKAKAEAINKAYEVTKT